VSSAKIWRVKDPASWSSVLAMPIVMAMAMTMASSDTHAQTATPSEQDEAVGASINYVFATDLGSGVYDLDGRTLQIYQLTYRKELRETTKEKFGVQFELPVTFGFFDFKPVDVISEGIPTRVDSFSAVPGASLDFLLRDDWRLKPYVRAGFSVASRDIDGWLYGAGVHLEKSGDWHGWDNLARSELAIAGVEYRDEVSNESFVRLRQGFDLRRGLSWRIRDREAELGLYAIFDVVLDPAVEPVAGRHGQSIQAEFGFTLATRPRYRIWRFDAPRLGFGYRLAGTLSGWRFVIGEPF
jgi:hypothetical protein